MALTLYKKKLAEPGIFMSAQGKVVITPERIKHWEKSFNNLRQEGFNFPVPWGHKLDAIPNAQDPFALEEQYARWNSGNINRLETNKDGSLWMIAETPPGYKVEQDTQRLVNEKDGTIVTDVSPGIGNWIDGQGREHKDIILHAALCTHPVQHNQTGFFAATGTMLPEGTKLLSTAGTVQITCLLQTKGSEMAKPEEEKLEPLEKEEAEHEEPDADNFGGESDEDADNMPEDDMDPTAEPKLPKMPDGSEAPALDLKKDKVESDMVPNAKLDEYVNQLKDEMAKLGQPLMDDTDRNNVVERMLMALKHAANAGASLSGPPTGGMEDKMPDLGVHGAPENSNMGASGGGVYSFMSTKTGRVLQLDATAHKFAAQAADQERATIAGEWDKLAAVGPAAMQAISHQEKNMLTRQNLSVNPDTCNVISKMGRERLAFAKSILKASGYFEFCQMLSTSTPLISPAAPAQGEDESQKEIVDDLVSRAYGRKAV